MQHTNWTAIVFLGVLAWHPASSRSEGVQTKSEARKDSQATSHPSATESKDPNSPIVSRDPDPRATLLAAAHMVWKARADRDCKTVAQYLDPIEYVTETAEERLKMCEEDPFRYEKYRIGPVEVEGRFGWVHVDYAAKFSQFESEAAQEIQTFEKWRFHEGQWYPVAARIQETCPESPSLRDADEEKRLKERFEATWKMKLAKDWKALYQLTDPNDRARVAESAYAESEGLIQYFEYELDWVQVSGDVGEVRVTYTNKLADPNMSKLNPRKINLSEHWIKRNGEWYRDLLRTK